MRKLVCGVLILSFGLVPARLCRAGEDRLLMRKAVQAGRKENIDFVFMHLRTLVRDFPDSPHVPEALFGLGEYFFIQMDYTNAISYFEKFLEKDPESKQKMYALFYLVKAFHLKGATASAEKHEKDLINIRQVGFIFKDSKSFSYLSPLNRELTVTFFIDRIEFRAQGALVEEIKY